MPNDSHLETLSNLAASLGIHDRLSAAAAIAATLTPLARLQAGLAGPSPLFLLEDATTERDGEEIASALALAACHRGAVWAMPGRSLAARLTQAALRGSECVALSYLPSSGDSVQTICAALTNETWSGRIEGTIESFEGPLVPLWLAVTRSRDPSHPDLARRTLRIVCDGDLEHPSAAELGAAHRAARALLLAWEDAGRPTQDGLRAFGGFEGWSATVRQALVWAGAVDPVDACTWRGES